MATAAKKARERKAWQHARAAIHSYEHDPSPENAKAVETACAELRHREDPVVEGSDQCP